MSINLALTINARRLFILLCPFLLVLGNEFLSVKLSVLNLFVFISRQGELTATAVEQARSG